MILKNNLLSVLGLNLGYTVKYSPRLVLIRIRYHSLQDPSLGGPAHHQQVLLLSLPEGWPLPGDQVHSTVLLPLLHLQRHDMGTGWIKNAHYKQPMTKPFELQKIHPDSSRK